MEAECKREKGRQQSAWRRAVEAECKREKGRQQSAWRRAVEAECKREKGKQQSAWRRAVEAERKHIGWKSRKMADIATRVCTTFRKLLSGLTHQIRCEKDK